MSQSKSLFETFLPVLSTILGAGIGFLASYLTGRLAHQRQLLLDREKRVREKLEELYETLDEVRRDQGKMLASVMNIVHNSEYIGSDYPNKMSGVNKINMVINMYFPELKEVHLDFLKFKDEVGGLFSVVLVGDYEKTESGKQAVATEYANKFRLLDNSITIIQDKIVKLVNV